jgi:hypothetical protein
VSVEGLPFALLLGEALLAELLDDCMSLELFAACGGLELLGGLLLGGVVLGEIVLGLFGLFSVEPDGLLGFVLVLGVVLELPIAPAPVPLELELAELQWSEIWRTSETWNALPVLAEAVVLPLGVLVEVLVELLPLLLPVTWICCPTYCCSLLVSPLSV